MQGSYYENAQLLIWYPVGSDSLIDMDDTVGKYCHATNRSCQPPIVCSTCGYRKPHLLWWGFCYSSVTYSSVLIFINLYWPVSKVAVA